jgi:hypothetical protein
VSACIRESHQAAQKWCSPNFAMKLSEKSQEH